MGALLPPHYWTLAIIVLPVATIYASVIDYRERRVPNWLNGALAALGIVAQASYWGWAGVGTALMGLMVGFGLLIIPWTMHGMGAGDVKLMAAIGAWLGPWLTLLGCVVGMLLGGLIGLAMILASGKLAQARVNLGVLLVKCTRVETAFSEFGSTRSFGSTTTLLPYGIPLTIGSLLILYGRYLELGVLL